jgi:hypothetical protein
MRRLAGAVPEVEDRDPALGFIDPVIDAVRAHGNFSDVLPMGTGAMPIWKTPEALGPQAQQFVEIFAA